MYKGTKYRAEMNSRVAVLLGESKIQNCERKANLIAQGTGGLPRKSLMSSPVIGRAPHLPSEVMMGVPGLGDITLSNF